MVYLVTKEQTVSTALVYRYHILIKKMLAYLFSFLKMYANIHGSETHSVIACDWVHTEKVWLNIILDLNSKSCYHIFSL